MHPFQCAAHMKFRRSHITGKEGGEMFRQMQKRNAKYFHAIRVESRKEYALYLEQQPRPEQQFVFGDKSPANPRRHRIDDPC